MIEIDQSPIGRTPRSNPATYTGVFTAIRDLFAMLPESRERGYKPGRSASTSTAGAARHARARAEAHRNELPAQRLCACDVCNGRRYNQETLTVPFNGHSIADLLNMPIADALPVLKDIPAAAAKLQTLADVTLGYIHLGQSATTLSGGEAHLMKLARELSKRQSGRTLYLLDEPTTGLHFDDVRKLLEVLHRLTDLGNTVIIIEHNLDIVRNADYVLDMGRRAANAADASWRTARRSRLQPSPDHTPETFWRGTMGRIPQGRTGRTGSRRTAAAARATRGSSRWNSQPRPTE